MPGVVEPPPPAGVVAPKTTKPFPAGPSSVAVLAATALVVLAQLYAAIPLLGPVGSQFGGNATFALATVYGLCYAVGFLLWGPAADRYGHKRVMVVGLAIVVATTLGCAFATSLHELSMLRGAQGLAAASFAPIALAYLSESVAPRWRAMAIGWVSTAFLIAGILARMSDGGGAAAQAAHLLGAFVAAARSGDVDRLTELLHADVRAYQDGGGKARAARRVLVGAANVARFTVGVAGLHRARRTVAFVDVNGAPGAVIMLSGIAHVLSAEIRDGRIYRLFDVCNPDKLTTLRRVVEGAA